MATPAARIAAAPASWGICELPGWGFQLPAERVLREMQMLGIRETELGPEEFLPGSVQQKAELLEEYGLRALGAFCPVVLHDAWQPVLPVVAEVLREFEVLGARMLVIAAATGTDTYDGRPRLTNSDWRLLIRNLEDVATLAAEQGVTTCVHPHMGTMVQTHEEVVYILESSDVLLCLDTGHLTVGGTDPLHVAHSAPGRIAHVHLKDVNRQLAEAVRSGAAPYSEAVRQGMYTPLGEGDVELAELVQFLERSGYGGVYVPELDRMLASEPDQEESVLGILKSNEFLSSLLGS
jgi:inosose dehydratase